MQQKRCLIMVVTMLFTLANLNVVAERGILPKLGFNTYAEGVENAAKTNLEYGIGADIALDFQLFSWGFFRTHFFAEISEPLNFIHPTAATRTTAKLGFDFASLHFPNILQKNVSTVLFLGAYDFFGSDVILSEFLKSEMPISNFNRYRYSDYFQVHTPIDYTGVSVYGLIPNTDFYMGGLLAWNGIYESSKNPGISFNVRSGGVKDFFAFDAFFGSTVYVTVPDTTIFRTGMSFLLNPLLEMELYTRLGFYDTSIKGFTDDILNNFYLMIEPRYRNEIVGINASFFITPLKSSNYGKTSFPTYAVRISDGSFWGGNVMFTFGDVAGPYHMEGGFGTLVAWHMNIDDGKLATVKSVNSTKIPEPTEFAVTPFFRYKTTGVDFDVTLGVRPLKWRNPVTMFFMEFALTAEF